MFYKLNTMTHEELQQRRREIGDSLFKMRTRRKLSAREIAEATGLTQPTVYKVEKGRSVALDSVLIYANFFDSTIIMQRCVCENIERHGYKINGII